MGKKRKLKLLGVILAVALPLAVTWYMRSRPHVSEIFTTQRPGGPKITWHSMEPRWQRGIGVSEIGWYPQCVKSRGSALYATVNGILLKIDKASGDVVWKRNLSVGGQTNPGLIWRAAPADGGRVIAAQVCLSSQYGRVSSTVRCLAERDGSTLWAVTMDNSIASDPVVCGALALVPLISGEVACLDLRTGFQQWRKQISAKHFVPGRTYQDPVMLVRAESGCCVVRAGAQHFIGIDPARGAILWSRTIDGSALHAELANMLVPFTLASGSVFISPSTHNALAWSAATGAPIWRRVLQLPNSAEVAPASPPIVAGDLVVVSTGRDWAALRRSNGSVAWIGMVGASPKESWPAELYSDRATSGSHIAYMIDNADPVIRRKQAYARTITADNVVAVNLDSGRELWRWQNDALDYPRQVIPEGDRLYCCTQDRVVALQPGPEETLPLTRDGRTQLAYKMIEDLCGWNPRKQNILTRFFRRLPWFHDNNNALPASTTHADICLMRLGADSTEPLLELIDHQLTAPGANSGGQVMVTIGSAAPYTNINVPLNLLLDNRAYNAIPALCADLHKAKSAQDRLDIAEALIRFNRPTAMAALFEYARGCKDSDVDAGEEAMGYLCTFAPTAPIAGAQGVTQAELTACLMAAIADPKSEDWLRRFARLELMRNRGDAARALAEKYTPHSAEARLMPGAAEFTKRYIEQEEGDQPGTPFVPALKTRDGRGTWWGVVASNYLGMNDVWVVQSQDGRHWVRPTVGLTDEVFGDQAALACIRSGGRTRLRITWHDDNGHRQTLSIDLNGLYRDSDGDGVPDIVERELGTDPHRKDSHATGLPDGNNKNPTYVPHRLSEDEQIYQAVIEAACLYSRRMNAGAAPANAYIPEPIEPDETLVLPTGPSRLAVPVYSHAHTVLMYPVSRLREVDITEDQPTGFRKPALGFDGRLRSGKHDLLGDDEFDSSRPLPARFRDRFPYMLSRDSTRARIGILHGDALFDVEVDRIAGRWLPVECRCIAYAYGEVGYWEAAVPADELPAGSK